MSLEEPEFLNYIKPMFQRHGADYDAIITKLADPKQKLEVLSHFYYFICAPHKNEHEVRSELQLVGVTSLMEAMMQETEYQEPFEYFESTCSGQNRIDDVTAFKEEYLAKHGAGRKVREYFKKYFAHGTNEIEGSGIEVWDGKDFVTVKKVYDVARFYYDMRSEFVHQAEMHGLRPSHALFAGLSVGGKTYNVDIDMQSYLQSFEMSFVRHWREKAEAL